jgi:hypothetical protein
MQASRSTNLTIGTFLFVVDKIPDVGKGTSVLRIEGRVNELPTEFPVRHSPKVTINVDENIICDAQCGKLGPGSLILCTSAGAVFMGDLAKIVVYMYTYLGNLSTEEEKWEVEETPYKAKDMEDPTIPAWKIPPYDGKV